MRFTPAAFAIAMIFAAAGCRTVEEVVRVEGQLTGVAVTPEDRLFVSFPRWVEAPAISVAEVGADGKLVPYPSAAWNAWDGNAATAKDAFVCVQSIWPDGKGSLWVMDPASPGFAGVVPGGAKVVRVELGSGQVTRVYALGEDLAPKNSYLNDLRVTPDGRHAVIADAMQGALVVLNLEDGTGRRLLEGDASTRADPEVAPIVEGQPWLGEDGKPPQIHSDGIELDAKGEWVYYQALTGRTLYRVRMSDLLDAGLDSAALGAKVERVAQTHPADGIAFGPDGSLYVTDLEGSAVSRLENGTVRRVASDPRFKWPDTLAVDRHGRIYVTASQIHRMPGFNGGKDRRERPFMVLRFKP